MKVEKIMTKQVTTCRPRDSLQTAARIMWEQDCGCVPVLDENSKVVGVITDRDICMAACFDDKPLRDIEVSRAMSKDTWTGKQDETIEIAERLMKAKQVRRLPVVNSTGRIVGILPLKDIAREAAREQNLVEQEVTETSVAETLAAVCQPHVSKRGRKQLQPGSP